MKLIPIIIFLASTMVSGQEVDTLKVGNTLYVGELTDGDLNGIGKEYSRGELIFHGEFKDGIRNGKGWGKQFGLIQEGIWKDGFFVNGKMTTDFNNRVYNGKWKGSELISGNIDFGNGYKVEASTKKLKPHGVGTMHFSNGTSILTTFKKGKPKGKATIKYQDGTTLIGIWKRTGTEEITLMIDDGNKQKATFANGDVIRITKE